MSDYNQNSNGRSDGGISAMNIGRKPTPRAEASRSVNASQTDKRGTRSGARTQAGRNLDVRLNTGMMGARGFSQSGSQSRTTGAARQNAGYENTGRSAGGGTRANADGRNGGRSAGSAGISARRTGSTGRGTGTASGNAGFDRRGYSQSGRNSQASDPQAKARAKARRRKKQQQRMMAMIIMGVVTVVVLVAVLFGVNAHMKSKKMEGFRTAGIEAMQSGDYAGAILNFDEAMKLAGKKLGNNEVDILQRRAEAAFSMQDYAGALDTWKTLMAKDSNNDEYKKNAVLCMLETGQYEEALQIGLMQSRIYNKMALDKIQAGDYEGALVLIDQGLSVDDGSARADLLYNQAVAHENRGNYAQALELFQQYVGTYGMDENVEREIEFLQTRVGVSAASSAGAAEGDGGAENTEGQTEN